MHPLGAIECAVGRGESNRWSSRPRPRVQEAAMSDEYAFVVATYVDLAAADADHSAVHQLVSGFDPSIAFDASCRGPVPVGRRRCSGNAVGGTRDPQRRVRRGVASPRPRCAERPRRAPRRLGSRAGGRRRVRSREPSWRGTDQGTFGDDANRTRRCCPDRPNESIRAADRVAPTQLMRQDRVADVRVAVLSAAPQSLRYPRIRALATASCRPWTLSLS